MNQILYDTHLIKYNHSLGNIVHLQLQLTMRTCKKLKFTLAHYQASWSVMAFYQ